MLSHWFTLIGLGLCLKTTRSYLTKLKQLLLALAPPTPPSARPSLHSHLRAVSKPLALLQSGLYPPPCPGSHVPLGGGAATAAPPPARLTSSGLTAPSTPPRGGRWVPEAGGGGGGVQTERTSCRAKRWYAWPSTLLDSARPTQQGCASSSR